MEITLSIHQSDEPVAIMGIKGNLDASNFMEVITKAQEAYQNPARNLIIDLSEVPYISSAGLVAIHRIALLYGGISQGVESGGAESRLDFSQSSSAGKHVKLLSPQPGVDQILETTGLKLFFKVFDDLESAIISF
ncbi:MAG TPA: STAS domain-containing protein [Anaerolineales bacterium]|nr:STAS domain-containing protein [Anaerolineales bacterium]